MTLQNLIDYAYNHDYDPRQTEIKLTDEMTEQLQSLYIDQSNESKTSIILYT